MTDIKHLIPTSEHDLLSAPADLTTLVKVTLHPDTDAETNGWYFFGRTKAHTIEFVRQSPTHPPTIEVIECTPAHIQFDEHMGALPNNFSRTYETVQPFTQDYKMLQQTLAHAGVWRPLRLKNQWEYIQD